MGSHRLLQLEDYTDDFLGNLVLSYRVFIEPPDGPRVLIGRLKLSAAGIDTPNRKWQFHPERLAPCDKDIPALSADILWELAARTSQNQPADDDGPALAQDNPFRPIPRDDLRPVHLQTTGQDAHPGIDGGWPASP